MVPIVASKNMAVSAFKAAETVLPTITQKVNAWVSKYFGLIQNGFFLGYGAKELLMDGILAKRKIQPLEPDATFVQKAIHKIKSLMANLFQVHGELYVASALAGTAVELHHLEFLNLGSLAPAVGLVGNGLFLYASLLSLAFHVDLYNKAKEIEDVGGVSRLVNALKASAIMGIINSIGYVLTAVATIVGGSVALALVFGCLALATGCVKVLFDYLVLSKRVNHSAL